MARPRKASACVTLVLIGTAALTGCSDNSSTSRRAAYATKEACLADWGDPKDCEEQQGTNSGGSYHYWGHSGGGGYGGYGHGGSSSSSGHNISHGGFGSHGSSSS